MKSVIHARWVCSIYTPARDSQPWGPTALLPRQNYRFILSIVPSFYASILHVARERRAIVRSNDSTPYVDFGALCYYFSNLLPQGHIQRFRSMLPTTRTEMHVEWRELRDWFTETRHRGMAHLSPIKAHDKVMLITCHTQSTSFGSNDLQRTDVITSTIHESAAHVIAQIHRSETEELLVIAMNILYPRPESLAKYPPTTTPIAASGEQVTITRMICPNAHKLAITACQPSRGLPCIQRKPCGTAEAILVHVTTRGKAKNITAIRTIVVSPERTHCVRNVLANTKVGIPCKAIITARNKFLSLALHGKIINTDIRESATPNTIASRERQIASNSSDLIAG